MLIRSTPKIIIPIPTGGWKNIAITPTKIIIQPIIARILPKNTLMMSLNMIPSKLCFFLVHGITFYLKPRTPLPLLRFALPANHCLFLFSFVLVSALSFTRFESISLLNVFIFLLFLPQSHQISTLSASLFTSILNALAPICFIVTVI